MKIPHFLLAIFVLAIPAHGPFEKESESRFHEMHLGMAKTLDPNALRDHVFSWRPASKGPSQP